jgi:3-isopropylmalate/(R)-2-methylmalate dehydratase large subunit
MSGAVFLFKFMSKNIVEKIWEEHVVVSREGYPDVLAIDLHLLHEVTSPQAFFELRKRGIKMHAADRTVATIDHNVSTAKDRNIITAQGGFGQISAIRRNCADFKVKLLDMDSGNQGIVHVIGPELGLTQPGMTIVCGDSHTSTHGAFGALAFGIGTTEVGHTMATSCILQRQPKTMKVEFKGRMPAGVTAKDLILKLIQQIGVGGAKGHVIEYCGEAITAMSIEERMTICNMSIECGARAGLIAPDDKTIMYLKDRKCVPKSHRWQKAVKYWKSLLSDEGCKYDQEIVVDIAGMGPMVTWGFNPGQSVEIGEQIPVELDFLGEKALDYVGLEAGQELVGVKVDVVFIGSCTNARISDLRAAAAIFKDRKVAKGVKVYIVPGSEKVRDVAKLDGLDRIFEDAGAEFRNPGCSMCLAMNDDKVPEGKRCASTSNRNFVGRQGKGSITHLMSPIMAAAAAIEGEITDIRKFL